MLIYQDQGRLSPFNSSIIWFFRQGGPANRRAAKFPCDYTCLLKLSAHENFGQTLSFGPACVVRSRSQVEMRGLEPLTSALQRRRSPN